MLRILIFNGTPQQAEARLVDAGSRPSEALLKASIGHHVTGAERIDYFTLGVADDERLPQGLGLGDFDGVWISGSPLNAYRLDRPSVREQLELVREIWAAGIPAFGSCWGLQVMTAALGGTVHLNPNGREVGVARRIHPTETGRSHAMYRDKALAFDALCSHEDEVAALPACGRILASNAVSRVQAAEMIDGERCFWGVQYHPEHDFSRIAAIIATRAERHLSEGLARTDADVAAIVADYRGLDAEPGRKDLAWKYGLGSDVLDPLQRTLEFRNWIETRVRPFRSKR